MNRPLRRCRRPDGEFCGFSERKCPALHLQRTRRTIGIGRGADKGAEFHHRFIENSGMIPVQQPVGQYLKVTVGSGMAGVGFIGEKSGQHALLIAIYHGKWLIKRKA